MERDGVKAEEIYRRLIRGEEVPVYDIGTVYQQVAQRLQDNHRSTIHLYNKGDELFFSLKKTPPVGSGYRPVQDELAPSSPNEIKADVELAERQKALAEEILKREITDTSPLPTREEVAALKYYQSLGKENAREVTRFLNSFAEASEDALGNANIDPVSLSDSRHYYMDKIRTWNAEEVAADRAKGGDRVHFKTSGELCADFVKTSVLRGHQIAALIMDLEDKPNLSYFKGKYPGTFAGAESLQNYNSGGELNSQQAIEEGKAALESTVKSRLCEP